MVQQIHSVKKSFFSNHLTYRARNKQVFVTDEARETPVSSTLPRMRKNANLNRQTRNLKMAVRNGSWFGFLVRGSPVAVGTFVVRSKKQLPL